MLLKISYPSLAPDQLESLFASWQQAALILGKPDWYVNNSIPSRLQECLDNPGAVANYATEFKGIFLSVLKRWRNARRRLVSSEVGDYKDSHRVFLKQSFSLMEAIKGSTLLYLEDEILQQISQDIKKADEATELASTATG